MNENFKLFEYLTQCLEDKTYFSIEAKEINDEYYLIIHIEERSITYTDRFGKRKRYRHLWQLTNWLSEKFDIGNDELIIS